MQQSKLGLYKNNLSLIIMSSQCAKNVTIPPKKITQNFSGNNKKGNYSRENKEEIKKGWQLIIKGQQ